MKKLIALLLCLALSLALFACASDEPATTAEPETTTEEATATEVETTTEAEPEPEKTPETDPEAMALAFVEAYYGAEYDKMCETIYPDLIDDEFEETFLQIMEDFEMSDFVVSDFVVLEKEQRSDEARAAYEQKLNDEYGLSLVLDELSYVTVEYLFIVDYDGEHYETTGSTIVAVAKIGEQWYVVNGDESKHYGSSSAEEAALSFYEAFLVCDYDAMSTTFYPAVDNDETREGFEYVASLMAEDEYECSDLTVTDLELRSSEDCGSWEAIYLEDYGVEIAISELYYVSLTYRIVGTISGVETDTVVEAALPVGLIDGTWYVLDGMVSTEKTT